VTKNNKILEVPVTGEGKDIIYVENVPSSEHNTIQWVFDWLIDW